MYTLKKLTISGGNYNLSGLTHFDEMSGFEIVIRSGLLRKPMVAADINDLGFA